MSNELWPVLRVLDERIASDGKREYFVKWKDGTDKHGKWTEWSLDINDSWTPQVDCPDLVAEFREKRAKEDGEKRQNRERSSSIAKKTTMKKEMTPKRSVSKEKEVKKSVADPIPISSKRKDRRVYISDDSDEESTPSVLSSSKSKGKRDRERKRESSSMSLRRSGRVKNNNERTENESRETSEDLPSSSTSMNIKKEPEQETEKEIKETDGISAMTMGYQQIIRTNEEKKEKKRQDKIERNKNKPQPRNHYDVPQNDPFAFTDDDGEMDSQPIQLFSSKIKKDDGEMDIQPEQLFSSKIKKEEPVSPVKLNPNGEQDEEEKEGKNNGQEEDDDDTESSDDSGSDDSEDEGPNHFVCIRKDVTGYQLGYTGRIVSNETIKVDGADKPTTFLRVVFRALNTSHWIRWDLVKEQDPLGFRDYLKVIKEARERKRMRELAKAYDEEHAEERAKYIADRKARLGSDAELSESDLE